MLKIKEKKQLTCHFGAEFLLIKIEENKWKVLERVLVGFYQPMDSKRSMASSRSW